MAAAAATALVALEARDASWDSREKALRNLGEAARRIGKELAEAGSGGPGSVSNSTAEDAIEAAKELATRLRRPLETQLRELRSALVREACSLISVCAAELGPAFAKTAAGLLPTLLDLVNSGNKVIAGFADETCREIFATLNVQASLPRLVTVLIDSKSKEMREACITYLLIMLSNRSSRALARHSLLLQDCLVQVLRDASSTVRARARDCFFKFEEHFPEDSASVLNRSDERTQRTLRRELEARGRGKHGRRSSGRGRSNANRRHSAPEVSRDDLEKLLNGSLSPRRLSLRSLGSLSDAGETPCPAIASPAGIPAEQDAAAKVCQPRIDGDMSSVPRATAAGSSLCKSATSVSEHGDLPKQYVPTREAHGVAPVPPPQIIAPDSACSASTSCASIASEHKERDRDELSLAKLVASHQDHLNKYIADLAAELELLKQYETHVDAGSDSSLLVKQYVSHLETALARKQHGITKLRLHLVPRLSKD